MTRICGIDYSYTSPAICVYDTTKELKFENLSFFNYYTPSTKKNFLRGQYGNIHISVAPEWSSQEERFQNIRNWAVLIIKTQMVDEVVLEGYAMGAKGSVFDIAENTGLLKQYLFKSGITFYKPSPTSVKKSFCGRGNAKKEEMVAEFDRRFAVRLHELLGIKEMKKPIDDIADSAANMLSHPYFTKKE